MSETARKLLRAWLLRQLEPERGAWLDAQIAALAKDSSDASLEIALGMVPRKLGKAELALKRCRPRGGGPGDRGLGPARLERDRRRAHPSR